MTAGHVAAGDHNHGGGACANVGMWTSRDRDLEHLWLLSLFYYISAGLSVLMALIPLIHVALGIAFLTGAIPESGKNSPPPEVAGLFFIVGGGLFSLFGWASTLAAFFVGRFLSHRQHRLFCMVVAGIWCIFIPYGTLLGVFTLLVLNRPSVQALFDTPAATVVGG